MGVQFQSPLFGKLRHIEGIIDPDPFKLLPGQQFVSVFCITGVAKGDGLFLVAFTTFVEVIIKGGRLEGAVLYMQYHILIIHFDGAVPKMAFLTFSFQGTDDCSFGTPNISLRKVRVTGNSKQKSKVTLSK